MKMRGDFEADIARKSRMAHQNYDTENAMVFGAEVRCESSAGRRFEL